MPAFLPPNLLALFAPRPPLEHKRPVDVLPWDKKRDNNPDKNYAGVADCLERFEKAEDQPLPIREETRTERKERIKKTRLENHKRQMQEDLMTWDPNKNKKATIDAYKSLFVGKLDFNTSEAKLTKEFEQFGKIMECKIILDKVTGKSKGYAFVEFEHEREMRQAYKYGDGIKIDGRKVLVDVERGRTVQGWRPRRFGGGLGDTRKEKQKKVIAKNEKPEKISLHDGPQHGSTAFEQMRSFGNSRKHDQDRDRNNYGGFGVDRTRDRGTGKYNPGYEMWDRHAGGGGGAPHGGARQNGYDRDRGDRSRDRGDERKEFDSRRERDRKRDGGRDGDVDRRIKRERRDKYDGYGGGHRQRDDRDDNVKREYRERDRR